MSGPARVTESVPSDTIEWLCDESNPAVAVLTRRELLGEEDSPELDALWARRNGYAPVAAILERMNDDGSWASDAQDYKKYSGTLWQVHFLGELHADGADERVRRAAEHAFSRQMPDGSWSAGNMAANASIACLTANVARALARLGHGRDERVVAALRHVSDLYRELGVIDCRWGLPYQLNGYCHMLTVKDLLFLAEVPRDVWPEGAEALRSACVAALRDKEVFRSLPVESREFVDAIYSLPAAEQRTFREKFLAQHPTLHHKEKPGWLRFGFPLSYNSDALEALWALAAAGEEPRPEYTDAIELVRSTADSKMRWSMRNSFNGKMLADVEEKGAPSRWLTLRALRVLEWAAAGGVR